LLWKSIKISFFSFFDFALAVVRDVSHWIGFAMIDALLFKEFRFLDRLLKNAYLLRFPKPSPCQARGRLVAAYYFKYASFVSSWASGFRLPARSRFGEGRETLHLGIFEQPAKNDLFSNLLDLPFDIFLRFELFVKHIFIFLE
jgi:hypothetical protein